MCNFNKIISDHMIIYQYNRPNGTACLLRCHNKDKVPYLVQLVPSLETSSADSFDIQLQVRLHNMQSGFNHL